MLKICVLATNMQISAKIMLKGSTRTISNGETLQGEVMCEHAGRVSL